ncbi:MAG TPA: DUF1003 domain-containing protein [Ignavibacteria bacterium]|nr:DUF1003 domain-containing protein [Ignavibacteria bacterium]HMR39410.1 DUF1003 domain-containing protein [Ignavibacteria bacterium]
MNSELPSTIKQIREKYGPIKNVNAYFKKNLSALNKVALWITEHVGSMGFFIIIFIWTVLWLSWNTLAPAEMRFDPFPGFVLWLFISNVIQIFLMPLIMIGQNIQSAHADVRAQSDFDINTKAEAEIEAILEHLDNQNKLIIEILNRLEKKEN